MSNNGGDCGEKRRGGVEIFFLMPQGKNEKTCSEILSDAYEQSEDNGLTPSWIAADKVMTKKPTKTVRILYFSRKMQIKKKNSGNFVYIQATPSMTSFKLTRFYSRHKIQIFSGCLRR